MRAVERKLVGLVNLCRVQENVKCLCFWKRVYKRIFSLYLSSRFTYKGQGFLPPVQGHQPSLCLSQPASLDHWRWVPGCDHPRIRAYRNAVIGKLVCRPTCTRNKCLAGFYLMFVRLFASKGLARMLYPHPPSQ